MKAAIGLLLAFGIGFGCRYLALPLPAPPVLIGALLVVAMTLGYVITDKIFNDRENKMRDLCGGPSGDSGASS